MSDMDRQHTQELIHTSMEASVVPVCWLLAGLYALYALAHPIFLSGSEALVMSSTALVTALIFAFVANQRSEFIHRISAPNLVGTLSILVGANTCFHYGLVPESFNTGNFIMWVLGNGFIVSSRYWFYVLALTAATTWGVLTLLLEIHPLDNWGWFMALALVVSIAIHFQRQHALRTIADREMVLTRRDNLLQSIVSSAELFQEEITPLFQHVCETACEELNIPRFGMWLASPDKRSLKRVMLVDGKISVTDEVGLLHASMPAFFEHTMNSATVSLEAVNQVPELSLALTQAGIVLRDRGLLISTIKVGDQVMGLTTAVAAEPRHWSSEDKAFAASLANIVAIAMQRDEALKLEQRAQQAERLESLGILAGGVAHDFNNLLAVIMGHAELLDLKTNDPNAHRQGTQAILEASTRARDLAQQMLAYSGRAAFDMQNTDLIRFVEDVASPLARELLGTTKLTTNIPQSDQLVVTVDTTQIRQVLYNLLLNARHAEASEVVLTVGSSTLNQTPENGTIELELLPHRYHWIEVRDNGCGMDAYTTEHMFDPFFSTRMGGSGLGLAAVLGILRAHQGTITVSSTVGNGTEMRIYFPNSNMLSSTATTPSEMYIAAQPTDQKIILVEDEPLVRTMTKTLLEQGSNEVFDFEGVVDMKTFLDDQPNADVDFAVIDLTLRNASGMDVLRTLREQYNALPAVIVSGYDAMDAIAGYTDEGTVVFLQKPYGHEDLWRAIEQAKGISF